MKRYKKIIFAAESGTCRAPMAAGLLRGEDLGYEAEILARGLVVLFPEPLNGKAEAVMAGKGIRMEDYRSRGLIQEDFSPDTLVIVFNESMRRKIMNLFGEAENVQVLTELTGEELEIMDPYGGDLMSYGLCLESMVRPIRALACMLRGAKEELHE